MSNIVAIVGRPNVGKSTLFNRLLERREAIVDSTAGVTRDRHYGKSEWNGKDFTVIDTGGYIEGSDDVFEEEIRKQVNLAVEEANSIIFVVDGAEGLTQTDRDIAQILQRTDKTIFLAVNKIDNNKLHDNVFEFYELGLDPIFSIATNSGTGTGELLDALVQSLPTEDYIDPYEDLPKITIAGRPNVGKSTFTNALLDEDRNIVTDIAGTTRDSIETLYNKFGHEFVLVDTAGIRRKKKVDENLEFYSVMRAIRAIEYSDVVMLMIDATSGLEGQDMNILHLAQKNNKGIVILVNKWDLVEKETNTIKQYEKEIKEKLAPFNDVPILFVSALNKQRLMKAVDTAMEVYENRKRRIKTSKLNEVMLPIIEKNPPPAVRGHYVKIKYVTQLPTYTPKFAFFANKPKSIKESYKRFVENQLRKNFKLKGVPIEVYFRQK